MYVWSRIQIFLTKHIWKKLYEFWILLYTSLIKIINWVCNSSWFLEYSYCFGILSLAIFLLRILPKIGVSAKGRAKVCYSQMPQHQWFNAMTVYPGYQESAKMVGRTIKKTQNILFNKYTIPRSLRAASKQDLDYTADRVIG